MAKEVTIALSPQLRIALAHLTARSQGEGFRRSTGTNAARDTERRQSQYANDLFETAIIQRFRDVFGCTLGEFFKMPASIALAKAAKR